MEMESEDQYIHFENEQERLRSSKGRAVGVMVVFIIISILALGYIALSEFRQPLFGKWPQMAKEYEEMRYKVDSLTYMKTAIDSLESVNVLLAEASERQEGVFFEVQIGAFEHFDLEKYKEQLAALKSESVDQMDKYTLGKFRKYSDAQNFKRDIEKMGIQGAFIVGKIDGQRAEISDAVKASRRKIYR
jgi:trehalose-6-phosphate synthase